MFLTFERKRKTALRRPLRTRRSEFVNSDGNFRRLGLSQRFREARLQRFRSRKRYPLGKAHELSGLLCQGFELLTGVLS
jgi:hypothetical protein